MRASLHWLFFYKRSGSFCKRLEALGPVPGAPGQRPVRPRRVTATRYHRQHLTHHTNKWERRRRRVLTNGGRLPAERHKKPSLSVNAKQRSHLARDVCGPKAARTRGLPARIKDFPSGPYRPVAPRAPCWTCAGARFSPPQNALGARASSSASRVCANEPPKGPSDHGVVARDEQRAYASPLPSQHTPQACASRRAGLPSREKVHGSGSCRRSPSGD